MQSLLRNTPRAIALAVLISITAPACVKQNQPGVGLVKFDSSAVFGAPTNKTDVPGFGGSDLFGDELPIADTQLPSLIKQPPRLSPDSGPCPPAKLTAFPKAPASVKVLGQPAEGLYRWKRALVVSKDSSKEPAQTTRPFALEDRAVRHIVRDNDHQFSFETVAPDPLEADHLVVTAFLVNTNPKLLAQRTVPARTIGVVDVPGKDIRVTDPADSRGILMTSIVRQDSKGTELTAFPPTQPMLIFPLEGAIVRSGETFNSLAIDASTGAILLNAGTIGRTSRIDACGEIVEGYAVTLKQTYTSDIPLGDPTETINALDRYGARKETREVSYVFATQYGAMPIAETLAIGDILLDPTGFIGKWELGGLTPTALPGSLK